MDVNVCLHFSVTDGSIYGYWHRQWGAFRVCPYYKHIPPWTSHTTPIIPLFLQPHQPTVSSWKLTKRLRKTKDIFHTSQAPNTCEASWWGWAAGPLLTGMVAHGATPQGPVLLTSSSHLPPTQQVIHLSLSRSSETQFLNCACESVIFF